MSDKRDVIAIILLIIVAVSVALIVNGWFVMLIAGALHSIFGWPVLSFGEGVIVALGLTVLGSFFRGVTH